MSSEADEQLKRGIAREVRRVVLQSDLNIVNGRFVREAVEDILQLTKGDLKQLPLESVFKDALGAAVNEALSDKPDSEHPITNRSAKPTARKTKKEAPKRSKPNYSHLKNRDDKEESEEIVKESSDEEGSRLHSSPTADPIHPSESPLLNKLARNGRKRSRVLTEESEGEGEEQINKPIKKSNSTIVPVLSTESKAEKVGLAEADAEIFRLKSLVRQCGLHKQVNLCYKTFD